jgi:hypothetical protein
MSDMSRRRMLKYSAAALGGVLGYKGLQMAGLAPAFGSGSASVNANKLGQAHAELGNWVYLTPQKLGGGSMAVDMGTGRCLAWISYWNYGDTCPISHHLAAYPSPDPYKGFEFVNSAQGGDNVMIYGLPTPIKRRGLLDHYGQGNNIYRVQYDGQQMNLMENVAESTGLGMGVHTVIYPDANGFACADGQKDICGFFDRAKGYDKTQALMAFRADWVASNKTSLHDTWFDGGTLRLSRLTAAKETGKYDYEGTRGNKIDWEMVPMAELLVARGQIPGDSPRSLTGLDAVIHHPNNRWSALILRMPAAAIIMDRKTWEPVCCLHTPEGSPGNLPVKKVANSPDTWEVKFDNCKCVAHEAGFTPDGNFFTQMNNLTQNNMAVFDTSDADPRNWKKLSTFVKDPAWVGEYPSPFHLCFSMDRSKMFVSVLHPKPANSGVAVVDTKTWKIIKKFDNVGPDCQTMAVTYDGKYVLQIYSGFQRLSCGIFIFTQDTLEPVGYLPNFGGHHDCVIVPTKTDELLNSRCTTL